MDISVFSDFGIEIIRRNDLFFIRYDSGGMVSRQIEEEISAEDAATAQKGESYAYAVLLALEKRKQQK